MTLAAPGAEKIWFSAYHTHIVIEAFLQDNHSSNHSYSSYDESKHVAG